jgi:TonB family protein
LNDTTLMTAVIQSINPAGSRLTSAKSKLSLLTASVALILAGCCVTALSQQSVENNSEQRNRGIELYKQGDNKGAVKILGALVKKEKTDADAWYFLGLALVRDEDLKNARKAFEATVKLKPDFGFAHTGLAYTLMAAAKNDEAAREARKAIELSAVDPQAHYVLGVVQMRLGRNTEALAEANLAIAQKPDFGLPYLLKSQTLLAFMGDAAVTWSKIVRASGPPTEAEREERRQRARKSAESFAAAADALQMYLKLAASDAETASWREQLETLRAFAGNRESNEPVFSGSEVSTKVKVLQKREPSYTDRARMAGIQGTVILRAVFSAAGTVEHILVLRSLPGGLTEQSIQVAKKIKFTPATKDGKPVAMILELQYNFALY